MLSRVANSIYWMCRYIERAENVARFIDVTLNLQADDVENDEVSQWSPLIMTTGDQIIFEEKDLSYTKEDVLHFLTFDDEYPNSILSCLAMARENGRTIREIMSPEMWEHLNNFYLELINPHSQTMALEDPHRFYDIIKMRSHLFTGLMYSTMSHGEAWNFARMGMMLERADKTSRILDVKYFMLLRQVDLINSPTDNIQWISVLRSTSAFEAYRKEMHQVTPTNVADFLIFDKYFPRSIYHCVEKANASLQRIYGNLNRKNNTLAEKQLGRLLAKLEFADIEEVIDSGLHEFLDTLQKDLNKTDEQIGISFFNIKPPVIEAKNEQ